MATAYLEVLNDYSVDESEFVDFRDALGRWACQFVGDVATPIAKYARELFGDSAVRALVLRWDKVSQLGKDSRLRDFAMLVDVEGDSAYSAIAENVWEGEAAALSRALHYLIVEKWDD